MKVKAPSKSEFWLAMEASILVVVFLLLFFFCFFFVFFCVINLWPELVIGYWS